MTFLPINFLEFSKQLLNDEKYDEETRYRTAISRSYYAAHLLSHDTLKSIGYNIQQKKEPCEHVSIHLLVIKFLKEENPTYGDMLDQLREKRNNADYILNDDKVDKNMASRTINRSEDIINYLQMLIYKYRND